MGIFLVQFASLPGGHGHTILTIITYVENVHMSTSIITCHRDACDAPNALVSYTKHGTKPLVKQELRYFVERFLVDQSTKCIAVLMLQLVPHAINACTL